MQKRYLVFLIFILFTIAFTVLWWKDAISPVDLTDMTPVMFTVPKGQPVKSISQNLKNSALIKDQLAFFIYTRVTSIAPKIQAGNYRLNKSMSIPEIAKILTHGTSDIWVVIIEGLRIEEIASDISRNLLIPEAEILKFAREGYMYPDTYLIPKDSTAEEIVAIMQNNFDQKVNDSIVAQGKKQGLSIKDVIILASIIEREVKIDKDRRMVAGILIKRLKNDWPLQVDATIQYLLGYQPLAKTWWKKDLTFDDLKTDSPYNTYINTGLPPAPISNPGLSSIQAVVNPEVSDNWFYLSDKNGNIHYASTQEEHDSNIKVFLNRE